MTTPQSSPPISNNTSGKKFSISIKKEYHNLLPLLSEKDFESLKASIKAAGLDVPVIVDKGGIILDGHHRFRACKELGIPLIFTKKEFKDQLEQKQFIIDVNLNRRHLNEFQKAELGFHLEDIEKQNAKQRMSLGGQFTQIANGDDDLKKEQKLASTDATTESAGKTSHIIAKVIGISPASYERSQKIKQLGTDDQKQSLREGRRSITQVYNQVRKQEIKNRLIQQAQEAAKNNPNYANDSRVRLIHADFRTLDQASIPDGSIHLVFTDPPYSRDWLQFFEPLGKLAFRVLEDGGSLVLYAGHYALPEILDLVGKSGLRYWWEIAIKHNGACRLVHHQHVFVKWKPLLWFVKGDELRTPDSIVDLIESEAPDKIFHDWQQSPVEAQHVISKLTIEGDVVLDPLMASGTTGIAALKEGRKFIGIDKDSEVLQKATDRIGAMLSSDKNSGSMGKRRE